jgi:chitinase
MSDTLPSQSLRLIGYFSASAVTTQNYDVDDIPAGLLSHVIYAFANVTAMGDCESVDPAGDAANFPQLLELKAEYPQLMVLISVGGASHSTNFSTVSVSRGSNLTIQDLNGCKSPSESGQRFN